MPAVRTLSDLITEIRERSDHENSDFVTDASLETWINQSLGDLYDLILDYGGEDALLATTTTTTTAGNTSVAVNAYRVLGVDVQFAGRWRGLRRMPLARRNMFEGRAGWTGPHDTRYLPAGRTSTGALDLMFFPTPSAVHNVRVWYLPRPTAVASGGFDLIAFNGWDEYLVADVCAKVLEKKEGDSRPFLRRKAEARARIINACKALDSGGLHGMRDVAEEFVSEDQAELEALRYG